MGDSYNNGRGNSEVTRVSTVQRLSKQSSISSVSNSVTHQILRPISKFRNGNLGKGIAGQAALFLLKVAVLEAVRRLSKAKCPAVWSGLQFLQVFCYPPLKWIQRWNPFNILVQGLQMLSQPLLVLSIATSFSDICEDSNFLSGNSEDSHVTNDPNVASESLPDSHSLISTSDTRIVDEDSKTLLSSTLITQLHEELKKHHIDIPPRLNNEELYRFYTASNCELPCFISSIKKTISWRRTYRLLTEDELNIWSNMVFWHGFDINHRPCLVVRLGFACTSLSSEDKPRFSQAIVSQVEYGVLHLVNTLNPQITVLVDCEGLSPLKIPMQMIKSCSNLLQDHFPNRLSCLFVIRLPQVTRVVLQTFLQVLKPVTRNKLKIMGDMYQNILSEYLQTLPLYLGGGCNCVGCVKLSMSGTRRSFPIEANRVEANVERSIEEEIVCIDEEYNRIESFMSFRCDEFIRRAAISILIFAAVVAFFAGIYDPESRPVLPR